jgi:type II secretory pathway component PulJ
MKLPGTQTSPGCRTLLTGQSGFTLAEVLAALLFMAIVIPVAVQGLRVASLAGEVAQRKIQAARVAETILNGNIVSSNLTQSVFTGTVREGTRDFQWTIRNEQWTQTMTNRLTATSANLNQFGGGQPPVNQLAASQLLLNLMSVEVKYAVQNETYTVQLSTLMPSQ